MKEYTTGNMKVDAMASIQITGNVIPQIWYKTITKENGKPHLLAISILADIVYWYRPAEVRDEATGQLIGYRKKFKADLLQRSYDQFAELFGESKRSITDAVIRLEMLGVIKREFRVIEIAGVKYNNVLFLDFFPERLYSLTYPDKVIEANGSENELMEQNTPITEFCERGNKIEKYDDTLSQNFVRGVTKKCDRSHEKKGDLSQNFVRQNTKNTTENTTKNISSSSSEVEDDIKLKEHINYESAQKQYPAAIVDAVFNELKRQDDNLIHVISPPLFLEICHNITEYASPIIRNQSAYIQKCIDNIIAGQKLSVSKSKKSSFKLSMKQPYDFDELERTILANQ